MIRARQHQTGFRSLATKLQRWNLQQPINDSFPAPSHDGSKLSKLLTWTRACLSFLSAAKSQRKEDMIQRAKLLVQQAVARKATIKRIVFMDGHGGFTYLLIKALLKSPLKDNLTSSKLRLVVVDTDTNCHRWHQLFFPSVIVSESKPSSSSVQRVSMTCTTSICVALEVPKA
eukprot:TRINITY_DN6290_c0_g1_i1.p1 TRINITY_DN6290_c0_g1~~TRINITY_DN6290_c0_g1_i1.p1  ORF type:complete len:173 (+),score=22.56 TRINITY_DN6290_c0_g1_i1:168-686(+)